MTEYAISYSFGLPNGKTGFGVIMVKTQGRALLFGEGSDVLNFGDRMIEAGKLEPGTTVAVLNVMRLPL